MGGPRKTRGWFSRVLRLPAPMLPSQSSQQGPRPPIKSRRSVSDFTQGLPVPRKEYAKSLSPAEMVRLNGRSMLYLPRDYAVRPLLIPTCIRATAQYLAENHSARGIFRVSGSARTVNCLFGYYCSLDGADANFVTGTVRCPDLPKHISFTMHDVASAFKRFLSVLQGGILGNISVFNALASIRDKLGDGPGVSGADGIEHSQLRARLIALAIQTIECPLRRELVYAIFGLLSLIGRAAEATMREGLDTTSPQPIDTTMGLVGYNALGIIFGPLIIGDLLEDFDAQSVSPVPGTPLLPCPAKSTSHPALRGYWKRAGTENPSPNSVPTIRKTLVANAVTEMVISSWQGVLNYTRPTPRQSREDAAPFLMHSNTRPRFPSNLATLKKSQS